MKKLVLILLFAAFTQPLLSQAIKPPHELAGFLLGQRRQSIEKALGKPAKEQKFPDGWIDVVFWGDEKKSNYYVFSFVQPGNQPALAIQFAGAPSAEMRPFLGLRLGASEAEIVQKLGKSSSIKDSEEQGTQQWNFEGKNYSIEVHEHVLTSIRLVNERAQPNIKALNLHELADAVKSCDIEALIGLLSGDLEIYKGENSVMFEEAAINDLTKPTKLRATICGEQNSLRAAFSKLDLADAEMELRMTENGPSGPVFKFPKSKILNEIFYEPEAGAFRVYEVKLR